MLGPVDLLGATVEPIVAFFMIGEISILVALVVAFLLARLHKGRAHHYLMLAVFGADLLVFKPLMYMRASSAWGSFPWEGTRIAIHLALSVVAAILGVVVVVLGFRYRIKRDSKMLMPPKGRMHRILGRLFIASWGLAYLMGVVIYLQAYY
jgi:uncharacterized membrane protein YozB (DUF420 family)